MRRDKSGRIRVAGLDFAQRPGAADDDARRRLVLQAARVRDPRRHAALDRRARAGASRSRSPTSSWSSATACATTTSASTRRRRRAGATASACAAASRSRCSRAAATGGAGAAASTPTCRAPTLSELRRHVTLPFELSEGDGALRGWFELKDGQPTQRLGRRRAARGRAAPRQGGRAARASSRSRAASMRAKQRRPDHASPCASFGFRTGDGLRWPQGDLRVAWRQRRSRRRRPAASSTPSASTSA